MGLKNLGFGILVFPNFAPERVDVKEIFGRDFPAVSKNLTVFTSMYTQCGLIKENLGIITPLLGPLSLRILLGI